MTTDNIIVLFSHFTLTKQI